MRLVRSTAVAVATLGLASAGCRPDAPAYDPLDFLAVGVDPDEEAEAVALSLAERGFRVESRVDGRFFVALGARSQRSLASAVRIVTSRGIAMGIDAPSRDRPTWRAVALLDAHGARDVDGDGEVEVFVSVTDEARPSPCVVVVRVRARGDAFEVPVDAREFGDRACAEEVRDVDGDGAPELLVGFRPWRVRGTPVPELFVPFVGRAGAFMAGDSELRRVAAARRVGALVERRLQARARGDVAAFVGLCLEVAWFERERGDAMDEVLASLERELATVTLDEGLAELVRQARATLSSP